MTRPPGPTEPTPTLTCVVATACGGAQLVGSTPGRDLPPARRDLVELALARGWRDVVAGYACPACWDAAAG